MARLAKAGGRLDPAEHPLDPLALLLADAIAPMACGAAIDCRAAAIGVLRDVRRHAKLTDVGDEIGGVVSLVATHGDPVAPLQCAHHLDRSLALCRAASLGHRRRHNQPVAILHQHVTQVAEFGSLARCLLVEPASGSVVEACVSLLRGCTRKSTSLLRRAAGGSPEPSFGLKLFMLAQASIMVPSTEKCSSDSSGLTCGSIRIAARKRCAISPSSRRSRFLVNTVTSHTEASIDRPTNQRNMML